MVINLIVIFYRLVFLLWKFNLSLCPVK